MQSLNAQTRLLNLGAAGIVDPTVLCRGARTGHCRMLNSIPGFLPLDASSTSLPRAVTTADISRHCQIPPVEDHWPKYIWPSEFQVRDSGPLSIDFSTYLECKLYGGRNCTCSVLCCIHST